MRAIISVVIFIGVLTSMLCYALMNGASAPKPLNSSLASENAGMQGQSGHRIISGVATPRVKRFNDVGELVTESSHIIIGVPVYQAAHLRSQSDRFVWTDYRVKVLRVLKGKVAPGDLISLRTEGGNMSLADGTEIETILPSFWKSPVKGQGYVLFLSKQNEASFYFRLTGGPQGMFLISPWNNPGTRELSLVGNEVVVPQVRASDRLMRSYEGMEVTSFLAMLPLETGK